MAKYGDLSPIIFNVRSGVLPGGNQRSKNFDSTAKVVYTEKFKTPLEDGTVARGYIVQGGKKFSYREVDWDEVTETAAMIAANKNAGEWDTKKLSNQLKELSSFDVDYDLDLTMFDNEELEELGVNDILVSEHTRKNSKTGVDEDEVPEKAPARTKVGDLYQLGNHRLLCGSSTDKKVIERLMEGARAIAAITDPPYSVGYENQAREPGRKTRKQGGDTYTDPVSAEDLLVGFIGELPSDVLVMSYPFNKHFDALHKATQGWDLLYELVWVKHHFAFVIGRRYQPQHEPILIFRRKGGKSTFNVPNNQSTVFEFDKAAKNEDHPTPKPVGLYELLVEYQSDEGDNVFEPFCGSGTTLIACEKTKRKCFATEIDPHYCDVIVARWEKYTGEKAKLLGRESTKRSSKK